MNINDLIFELMAKYEWMPASIARFILEHNIDIASVPELN